MERGNSITGGKLNIDDDIKAIASFVDGQKLTAPFISLNGPLKAGYQNYLALLLIRHASTKIVIGEESRKYFDECMSDASYALYLSIVGMYKPARLSLRGAIENSLRFLSTSEGISIENISVTNLFNAVEALDRTSLGEDSFKKMKKLYTKLCSTIHTVDINFMAQKIPLGSLIFHEEKEFQENISTFTQTMHSISVLVFVFLREVLPKLDASQQDFVNRTIPKSVRKAMLDCSA